MAKNKKHWAEAGEAGEAGSIAGIKILLAIYNLFGRKVFQLFLYPVMLYYFLVKKEARLASRQYLEKVSRSMSGIDSSMTPFNHFMKFGEIILDKFLAWMGKIRKNDVVFALPDETRAFENNTDGGIIIVSHLGNNEVCAALADYLPKIRMTLLVYTKHAERFNRLIQKFSGHSRIRMFQVTDISPAIAMILAERANTGEYIIIAGDRTPVTGNNYTSTVDFFGDKAELPQGAFILAALLKKPVFLLFCLKNADKYHLYIEKFANKIQIDRRNKQASLTTHVQAYASKLEIYCQKAPLQWFNFFPYWDRNNSQEQSKLTTPGETGNG